MGEKFIGIERDREYFDIACRRIEEAQKQGDFFVQTQPQTVKTTSLFEGVEAGG